MRLLLALAIRLYWRLWPTKFRRSCLFRESCSRHVYRVTVQSGAVAGLFALRERLHKCRTGYRIETIDGQWIVRLVDGSILAASEASPSLLQPFQATVQRCLVALATAESE